MSSSNSAAAHGPAGFVALQPGVAPAVSSADARVLRSVSVTDNAIIAAPLGPELRSGQWTRFGDAAVLGDAVTERTLTSLADSTRAAARAQGYTVGWAEGRREAAAQALVEAQVREEAARVADVRRAARHRAALAALADAADRLARATEAVQQLVHDQAVELARELTEAMLGHELRTGTGGTEALVRRVLAERPPDTAVSLRLHPSIVDDESILALAASGVRVLADPQLDPGDAVLELDERVVDLRMSSALDRVREVLS